MKEKKQYEVLQWASLFLEKHQREKRVAEILLQHHLHVDRSVFFMRMHDTVPKEIYDRFKKDIEQHAITGIPVQHIIGSDMFYGRSFFVNEHVLIPRPETEELVQFVISYVQAMTTNEPLTIVDLGTGSGVIAISLALELPQATVYATDISKEALCIATRNATSLHATVHFMEGDFLQPLLYEKIQPHIIVANPPYIGREEEEKLADTVKNFDPALALFAEENGFAGYKSIISHSQPISERLQLIAFEIGYAQGASVCQLLKNAYPNIRTRIEKDINANDRLVLGDLAK